MPVSPFSHPPAKEIIGVPTLSAGGVGDAVGVSTVGVSVGEIDVGEAVGTTGVDEDVGGIRVGVLTGAISALMHPNIIGKNITTIACRINLLRITFSPRFYTDCAY